MGTVLDFLELLKFSIFPIFSFLDPPGCIGQNFCRKNDLEECWKHDWTLFGTYLGIFINESFPSFWSFSKFRPSRVHWARKNRKNITSSKFGHFWKRFSWFWNFEIFSIFVVFLSRQGALGRAFSVEKINQNILKQCFLGSFFDVFENFELLFFLKLFPSLDPPGCTGDFFSKEIPQNRFRTCLDNIRDSFGHLRNIEIFHFFQSFPYSTLQVALGKNFAKNITSKHVQNMFHCFWERFLGIFKKKNFFSVFWSFSIFPPSRVHCAFFSEKTT